MRSGSGIRRNRVRHLASTLVAVGVLLVSSGIALMATSTTATAVPTDNSGVCGPLDSGKIDVTGHTTSLPVSAPEGKLIDGYCVKAGSENQGDGPRYVTVDPPTESVTITYLSDGKAKEISHYSLSYTVLTTDDAVAAVSWVEPDCDNDNTVGYTRTADEFVVTWAVEGDWMPGGAVTVTATAAAGHAFAGAGDGDPSSATKVFPHEFGAAEENCTVEPPVVEPPVVELPVVEPPGTTVTPTVVSAGLAGDTTSAARDQLGLGLVVAGALLLAGAGGLRLTRARVSSAE